MVASAILVVAAAGVFFVSQHRANAVNPLARFLDKTSTASVYYDLPRVTADLSHADGYYGVAKVRISAELDDEDVVDDVKLAQGKIVQGMQAFLESKTRTDLDGRPGAEMMRTGFTGVVNSAIKPHVVRSVLFREIVIQ